MIRSISKAIEVLKNAKNIYQLIDGKIYTDNKDVIIYSTARKLMEDGILIFNGCNLNEKGERWSDKYIFVNKNLI